MELFHRAEWTCAVPLARHYWQDLGLLECPEIGWTDVEYLKMMENHLANS